MFKYFITALKRGDSPGVDTDFTGGGGLGVIWYKGGMAWCGTQGRVWWGAAGQCAGGVDRLVWVAVERGGSPGGARTRPVTTGLPPIYPTLTGLTARAHGATNGGISDTGGLTVSSGARSHRVFVNKVLYFICKQSHASCILYVNKVTRLVFCL